MLVVKWFSSNSAVFVLHIIFLLSFVTGAWYNTHYTTWDILGMMKKPRARLCKQYAALPQRMLWGRLHFRKVESLQGSPCYLRTVHTVPLGSHVPQKRATCSVSVAKMVTSALPDRNGCCHKPLCKMCKWKTASCVCLHVGARSLFSFSSSHVILLEEHLHSGSWSGGVLRCVCSFWCGTLFLRSFLFTCIYDFCSASNRVLLFLLLSLRIPVFTWFLSFAPSLGTPVFQLTLIVTVRAV